MNDPRMDFLRKINRQQMRTIWECAKRNELDELTEEEKLYDRTMHRIKWMWKLHMVHHSETKVDATTGTRHHPGDYILREFIRLGRHNSYWCPHRILLLL